MAASAKRKQEEKHLKMLREMTSLPPNRKCFDCDQRGPTYANMTVGSFVCTTCSGILRGLNPPHRVKSISMTTFTQQEIEFLQKHGNEVCKQIWLGLYDDRTSAIPDFREPQKVKEFLQEKYEKKRWFVPPEQAKVVASVHASISGSSASSTSSTPEVRPLKTLLGESAPTLHLNKTTPSQSPVVGRVQAQQMGGQFQEKKFDLLSDLGGDIFAAPPSQTAGSANFANFAHFNSHPAQSTANADFANFDAFGNTGAPAHFPPAPQPLSQPPHTAFTALSSSRSVGDFATALPHLAAHSSTSGLANANFANFDNFPKSSSADFGSFSSSQSNSTGVPKAAVDSTSVPADRYAALADLDNIFSSAKPEPGGGVPSGVSSAPASAGVVPPQAPPAGLGGDRYAALAELDNVFSSSASTSSVYSTSSTAPGNVFSAVTGVTPAQAQQVVPNMPQGFGAAPSTNPFVAAAVAPATAPTNPFQTNGRAAAVAAAATFGTGSMSMPAGFGNAAAYNLPTSFSGTFQQPLPGQAPFPQPPAYPPQPNGAGFAAFGQAKPVVTPFGQALAGPGVSSNPFLAGAPTGQYPTGSSSTNPFL
ncbi:arf-GAP domain and FG repeat-containing protein 1a isoform X2 [Megalops cyprinoides]|uniref:arf-GAP domain and FG repeat-containing protein 1a isoform X2 n=1 Tax=Megalops cyprinoides TaxID=118141 RepID=UPI001864B3C6|nr:arf-GAP domain and FG repeat-containing protein 1a isoform X2 [Megalops cyprinoides]